MNDRNSMPHRRYALALAIAAPTTSAFAQTTELQRVEITGTSQPYQAPPTSAAMKTDAIRNVAGTGGDFGFNGSAQPLILLRGFQTESMTAPSPAG